MTALLSPAALAFAPSRRLGVMSGALRGAFPSLAGRLQGSRTLGRIAVKAAFGLLDPLARRAAREERVDARAHPVPPSVLTVRGNRASLAGIVATSADLPNLFTRET